MTANTPTYNTGHHVIREGSAILTGDASAEVYGTAQVRAYDSAQVEAWDASQVTVFDLAAAIDRRVSGKVSTITAKSPPKEAQDA